LTFEQLKNGQVGGSPTWQFVDKNEEDRGGGVPTIIGSYLAHLYLNFCIG